MKLHALLFVSLLGAVGAANAQAGRAGPISLDQARARPSVAGQPSGAAYLRIENKGSAPDRLVSAASPVAGSVEIHTMAMEGNVMKMREADGIALPPKSTVSMQPGMGYHIMLMGLRQPLKAGDKFPMTLTFEKAGKAELMVEVTPNASAPAAQHGQSGHDGHDMNHMHGGHGQ
ncbi:copper chaperone PCu(A)C [Noviherbaspirillum galbum]|nr:copper chaperone PCu(A)C [Noviherbaspirillum galbum]